MFRPAPTEEDIKFHLVCVTHLISFGAMLEVAASQHNDGELANHRLKRVNIEAMVQDLRNTYDEWYGQVPEERIDQLSEQIFDAAPELNLKVPRAKLRASAPAA